jgi:hypothetical protein
MTVRTGDYQIQLTWREIENGALLDEDKMFLFAESLDGRVVRSHDINVLDRVADVLPDALQAKWQNV